LAQEAKKRLLFYCFRIFKLSHPGFILYLTLLMEKLSVTIFETTIIESEYLERDVTVDFYLPVNVPNPGTISLLLINDGQNMEELGLTALLDELCTSNAITPLLCVGIHAGTARKMEYGTAHQADYLGRGAKAAAYTRFIFDELLPYIRTTYHIPSFREKAFCGFSLGGLSALDIVWNYPHEFFKAGVFSGSLWWRTKDLEKDYDEKTDRIMHAQVRDGEYVPWLQFFFQTGTMDEDKDRNNNGVIDSIDDTKDLIAELVQKGYSEAADIQYLEIENGKHDIATWAKAMPAFLKWGWGTTKEEDMAR
jgi:enterochelin esterase-like enzyme